MGIPLPRFRHFCLLLIAIAAVVGVSCRDTQRFGAASVPVAYPACVNLEAGADATPGPTQCGPVSGVLPVANGGTGNAGGGATPLISSWAQIPGCVAYWVCDLGLTLGDSGTVFTWTDQVGGYVLGQGVNADQPTQVTSWLNGHCGVQFTNQSATIVMSLDGGTWPGLGYPYSVLAVVEPTTSSPSSAAYIVATNGVGPGLDQLASALTPSCYDGTTVTQSTGTMIVNKPAFLGCLWQGTNDGGQAGYTDNVIVRGATYEVSGAAGTHSTAGGLAVGGLSPGNGQGFGGQIGMIGVFNTALNRQYLIQAQAVAQSYYGNPF